MLRFGFRTDKHDLDRLADRAKEYAEEDYDYGCGHYAAHTELAGPFNSLESASWAKYGGRSRFIRFHS